MRIKVTEDNDAIFSAVRVSICICFYFDIAIDGKALPVSGQSSLYSASVIYSQVWVPS